MNYVCSNCGGKVTKNPCVRSEADKKERKFSESGLGTWHCTSGCKPRVGTVKRFVGSGKEEDSQRSVRMESVHILRKIAVRPK